jgi:hypothetical protein
MGGVMVASLPFPSIPFPLIPSFIHEVGKAMGEEAIV